VLRDFAGLGKIVRQSCSAQAATYLKQDLELAAEDFFEMIRMLARDGADPASVANPPARILTALRRERKRQEGVWRSRWSQYDEDTVEQDGALTPNGFESAAVVRVDWENGRRNLKLPDDQARAIVACYQGLNLQSREAAEWLAWDAARVATVRRSLGADRHWGRRVREYFAPYRGTHRHEDA
jgi:hypothetical protein